MRMGLPHVILSDNGKEFDNHLDTMLADLLGIKRRLTTPYHPQVNPIVLHNNCCSYYLVLFNLIIAGKRIG